MTSDPRSFLPVKCETCLRRKIDPPRLGRDPHPCPYQQEINDDSETLCNCCAECQAECADDI